MQQDQIKVVIRFKGGEQLQESSPWLFEQQFSSQLYLSNQQQLLTVTNQKNEGKKETYYKFDSVATPETGQNEFYENCAKPIINDFMNGYNTTIFAYGQTGSGQTYTMLGPKQVEHNLPKDPKEINQDLRKQFGIIPNSIETIFQKIAEGTKDQTLYNLKCNYLEIYNETITDLLSSPINKQIAIKSLPEGIYLKGLQDFTIKQKSDLYHCVSIGNSQRVSAQTAMNQRSSRSHAILIINMQKQYINGSSGYSKLNLVDLAGCENLKKSQISGTMVNETKLINKSLTALGMCILALSKGNSKDHIPYRQSKLTLILKQSLGGNSRTVLICTCSSKIEQLESTKFTLSFARRAKAIKNQIEKVEKQSREELQRLVDLQNKEIVRLKLIIQTELNCVVDRQFEEAFQEQEEKENQEQFEHESSQLNQVDQNSSHPSKKLSFENQEKYRETSFSRQENSTNNFRQTSPANTHQSSTHNLNNLSNNDDSNQKLNSKTPNSMESPHQQGDISFLEEQFSNSQQISFHHNRVGSGYYKRIQQKEYTNNSEGQNTYKEIFISQLSPQESFLEQVTETKNNEEEEEEGNSSTFCQNEKENLNYSSPTIICSPPPVEPLHVQNANQNNSKFIFSNLKKNGIYNSQIYMMNTNLHNPIEQVSNSTFSNQKSESPVNYFVNSGNSQAVVDSNSNSATNTTPGGLGGGEVTTKSNNNYNNNNSSNDQQPTNPHKTNFENVRVNSFESDKFSEFQFSANENAPAISDFDRSSQSSSKPVKKIEKYFSDNHNQGQPKQLEINSSEGVIPGLDITQVKSHTTKEVTKTFDFNSSYERVSPTERINQKINQSFGSRISKNRNKWSVPHLDNFYTNSPRHDSELTPRLTLIYRKTNQGRISKISKSQLHQYRKTIVRESIENCPQCLECQSKIEALEGILKGRNKIIQTIQIARENENVQLMQYEEKLKQLEDIVNEKQDFIVGARDEIERLNIENTRLFEENKSMNELYNDLEKQYQSIVAQEQNRKPQQDQSQIKSSINKQFESDLIARLENENLFLNRQKKRLNLQLKDLQNNSNQILQYIKQNILQKINEKSTNNIMMIERELKKIFALFDREKIFGVEIQRNNIPDILSLLPTNKNVKSFLESLSQNSLKAGLNLNWQNNDLDAQQFIKEELQNIEKFQITLEKQRKQLQEMGQEQAAQIDYFKRDSRAYANQFERAQSYLSDATGFKAVEDRTNQFMNRSKNEDFRNVTSSQYSGMYRGGGALRNLSNISLEHRYRGSIQSIDNYVEVEPSALQHYVNNFGENRTQEDFVDLNSEHKPLCFYKLDDRNKSQQPEIIIDYDQITNYEQDQQLIDDKIAISNKSKEISCQKQGEILKTEYEEELSDDAFSNFDFQEQLNILDEREENSNEDNS